MAIDDIGRSLVDTISRAGAKDLLIEIGDHGLEAVLKSDAIKDVPVIGAFAKLISVGSSVRDYLFVERLLAFLSSLADIPEAERLEFSDRMERDPKSRKRVGQSLVVILDRIDEFEKVEMLARAFAAYMKLQIELPMFIRVARAIERCLCDDLAKIPENDQATTGLGDAVFDLEGCGLIERTGIQNIRDIGTPNSYRVTSFGRLLKEILLAK